MASSGELREASKGKGQLLEGSAGVAGCGRTTPNVTGVAIAHGGGKFDLHSKANAADPAPCDVGVTPKKAFGGGERSGAVNSTSESVLVAKTLSQLRRLERKRCWEVDVARKNVPPVLLPPVHLSWPIGARSLLSLSQVNCFAPTLN